MTQVILSMNRCS